MAKKKSDGSSGKKRAPFTARVTAKLAKLAEWIEKTKPRFSSEPKGDVMQDLAQLEESLAATIDNLAKIGTWQPPARSPAFSIGDEVYFKKEVLVELKKNPLYSGMDLEGEHEVELVHGRKVKLVDGIVWPNTALTKNGGAVSKKAAA